MFIYLFRLINIRVRLSGEGEDSISFNGNLTSRGKDGPELMVPC